MISPKINPKTMKIDPSLYSGGQPPSRPPPQPPQGTDTTLHSAFPATPPPPQQPQPQHEKPSPHPPQNPSMFTPRGSNATHHGAFPATPPPQPQYEKPNPYPPQKPQMFTPQGSNATHQGAFPATPQPQYEKPNPYPPQKPQMFTPQGSNATHQGAFPATPQPQYEKPNPYPPQKPQMFTPQGSNATHQGAFPATPQPQYEKPNPYPPQKPQMFTLQGNYHFHPQNQKQAYPHQHQAYPPSGQSTKGATSATTSYSGYDQAAMKFPPQSSPLAAATYYSPATNPTYAAMPQPASPLKQTARATGIPTGSPFDHQQSSSYLQPPNSATSTSWKGSNGQPKIDPGKVCGAIFRLVSAILGLSSLLSCACRTKVSRGIDGTGPPVMESHCVWNFCDLCGDDNKGPKHNPHHSPYGNSNMPMQYQQPQPMPQQPPQQAGMMPPLKQNMRA